MTRALLRTAIVGAALAVAGAGAGNAGADGLPTVGVEAGPDGVAAPEGGMRYVTIAGPGLTVVVQVERRGGRVLRSSYLPGKFVVPVVAYDGTAGGISPDGGTLVLLHPRARFPRARTTLAVFDARRLKLHTVFTLHGDFSFDALSVRGRLLYLIQYTSRKDPTRYAVRAYDLRFRRLLARPVVDPNERDEAMRGSPITRATSADGRWAYTLYDGAGKEPFVHALDTSRKRAVCVDLAMLAGRRDLYALKLSRGPDGSVTVTNGRRPLALIDTRSFHVSEPVVSGPSDGRPWLLPTVGTAVGLLATALLALRVRRWRRSAPVPAGRTG